MDVDIPQNEESMETDPPITTEEIRPELGRKDSILDPDGDEVMQGEEEAEVYDEDVEIGEGDEIEEGGDYDVDLDAEEDQGIGETQDGSLDTTATTTGTTTGTEDVSSASVLDPSASTSDSAVPLPTTESTTALNQDHGAGENVETETELKSAATTTQGRTEGHEQDSLAVDDAVEQANGNHHEEGTTHEDEGADEEEGNEHEEEEDEEEEDQEEYDLITPQTLPPIILNLPNSRISLFKPYSPESEISTWFGERLEELCEAPLTSVWGAIRLELEQEGDGNDDEMVVIEKLMDLKMGDSDVNLEDVTFLELVQMYHDCQLPTPMELHLEFHPHRFITRFNAIQKELEAREVVYIEDDDDEEEGDHEGLVEETQEGVHADEGGEQGSEGQTNTHQLPVPLPPLQPGQDAEGHDTQADEPTADASAEGETGGVAEVDSAGPVTQVKEAAPLPPTDDEIRLAKAGEPVDESVLNQAEQGNAETSHIATADPATGEQVSESATSDGAKADVSSTNTDPIGQPAGVPEVMDQQDLTRNAKTTPPMSSEEQAAAAEVPESDRVGTDLDTTEGQAQTQPIAGEAAVYEPAGDEDDDLIEGGEEYEEGDYDDELVEGEAEGVDGAAGADGAAEAEGIQAEVEGEGQAEAGEAGEEADEVEGEDGDPYGVDGFVNGLDTVGGEVEAGDTGGEVFEEEYEEYEDGYDPEAGAEGEVYETKPEAEPTEVEADASVDPEENGEHVISADDELGIERQGEGEQLVDDGEAANDAGAEVAVEGETTESAEGIKAGEGDVSPSVIKRGRSADLEENEVVAGKKVRIDEVE